MQTKEMLEEILGVARKIIAEEVEKQRTVVQSEEKETHVVIVLDSSGSMSSIKQETIGAFNGFIDTITENADKGGKTTVSLVVFGEGGGGVEVKIDKQPISAVQRLTNETYNPGAYTPMFDGIGTGISLVTEKDVANKNVSFLVQTFTDGYENASKEWTGSKLKEKIQSLEKKGNWTFTFAGANIDVNAMVDRIGVQRVNSVSYEASAGGMRGMSAANNVGTQSYFDARMGGAQAMAGGFYEAPLTPKGLADQLKLIEEEKKQRKAEEKARFAALDKQVKGDV